MEKHPGVGLGDVSALPDRQVIKQLSREAIQALLPAGCDANEAVLTEGPGPLLGKRIFVINPDDISLHPATGGPVILRDGVCYQLTVAHAFDLSNTNVQSPRYDTVKADDCDFDGMSDNVGDGEGQDNEMTRRGSITPDGMNNDKDSFRAKLDLLSGGQGSDTLSSNPSSDYSSYGYDSRYPLELVPDSPQPHAPDVSRLCFYGRLVLSSKDGSNPLLDYSVIEIAPETVECGRQVALDGSFAQTLVNPPAGEIGSDDICVVAAMSRSPLVEGRLVAIPSYICFPDQNSFQQVYTVRLETTLADGDCGAAIFDKHTTHFYGHIIADGLGTAVGHLVPASEIFRDLEEQLGLGLTLQLDELTYGRQLLFNAESLSDPGNYSMATSPSNGSKVRPLALPSQTISLAPEKEYLCQYCNCAFSGSGRLVKHERPRVIFIFVSSNSPRRSRLLQIRAGLSTLYQHYH